MAVWPLGGPFLGPDCPKWPFLGPKMHIIHCIALHRMVLHGIALHLMILHSLACHCIVSYGVAGYCIVGFGARAVSRKTPTYFMLVADEEPRAPINISTLPLQISCCKTTNPTSTCKPILFLTSPPWFTIARHGSGRLRDFMWRGESLQESLMQFLPFLLLPLSPP